MQWYTVTKTINGRHYLYRQKTYRKGKSVKTINQYIGPTGDSGGGQKQAKVKTTLLNKVKKSNRYEQVEFEIFTEMLELSVAGHRVFSDNGSVKGISSTFPEWVPKPLRSMKLFEKVTDLIEHGNTPVARATKQAELYDVVVGEMEKRVGYKVTDADIEDYMQRKDPP